MRMMSIEDPEYNDRSRIHMLDWAQGNVYHNRVDDECVPDFSCCVPDMFTQDESERWLRYHNKYGRKQ